MPMPGQLAKLVDADLVMPGLFMGAKPMPAYYPRLGSIALCAREYQPSAIYFPSVTVLHVPLDDDSTRDLKKEELRTVLRAVSTLASLLTSGKTVLVTCAAGLNRSGLVTALTMHRAYGVKADAIIRRIRSARGPWALSNPKFVELVKKIAV